MKTKLTFNWMEIKIQFSHPTCSSAELELEVDSPKSSGQRIKASWGGNFCNPATADMLRAKGRSHDAAAHAIDILTLCSGTALYTNGHFGYDGLEMEYDDEAQQLTVKTECWHQVTRKVSLSAFRAQVQLLSMMTRCSTEELYRSMTADAVVATKGILSAAEFACIKSTVEPDLEFLGGADTTLSNELATKPANMTNNNHEK
jgi:hypothetical protein